MKQGWVIRSFCPEYPAHWKFKIPEHNDDLNSCREMIISNCLLLLIHSLARYGIPPLTYVLPLSILCQGLLIQKYQIIENVSAETSCSRKTIWWTVWVNAWPVWCLPQIFANLCLMSCTTPELFEFSGKQIFNRGKGGVIFFILSPDACPMAQSNIDIFLTDMIFS